MRVLYDLIHARAAQTWHESINIDNFNRWAKHWIDTAIEIENEFARAGLFDTDAAIRKIIEEQSEIAKLDYYDPARDDPKAYADDYIPFEGSTKVKI